jgi:hypothetical protein
MVEVKQVFYAILLSLLAALCFAVVWSSGQMKPFWQVFIAVAGIAFLLGAILIAANYITEVVDAHNYRARRYAVLTPETEELRLLTQMTPFQADIWFKRQVALVAIPGVASAELYYSVDGELIPAAFVHKWLNYCDDTQLAPKRHFSDGPEYDWSDRLTAFYVNRGLAHPHVRGSGRAATWKAGISLEQAQLWFHMSEA